MIHYSTDSAEMQGLDGIECDPSGFISRQKRHSGVPNVIY